MNYFTLYTSCIIFPRDSNQTIGIAKGSLGTNKRDGIIGFLRVEHGAFYHYFEGAKQVVEAVFDRVRADKRHSHITLIVSAETDKRLFPDFDMGLSSALGRQIAYGFNKGPDRLFAQAIIQFLKEARDEQSLA